MTYPRTDHCDDIGSRPHDAAAGKLDKADDMDGINAILEPGMLVRHPTQPDWGVGQVQSNIGARITVNFREIGKVVIDGTRVSLSIVSPNDPSPGDRRAT